MRRFAFAATLLISVSGAGGCGGGAADDGPVSAEVLSKGRTVYSARCASCHGVAGDGGVGPALSGGRVVEHLPDVENQEVIVRHGRGRMPGFEGLLTDDEIDAVIAYTREGL